MKILFVCTGNTCRSPMAEAVLKDKTTYEVQSAGIAATTGISTNPQAVDVLKENKIDYTGTSQPLTSELVDWADLILTMTYQHKQAVVSLHSDGFGKTYTLKEYVNQDAEEIWEALKQAHLNIEEKRSLMTKEPGHELTEQQIREFFQEELEEVARLEAKLPSLDIADPYGLDRDAYEKTLTEIREAIDALTKLLTE